MMSVRRIVVSMAAAAALTAFAAAPGVLAKGTHRGPTDKGGDIDGKGNSGGVPLAGYPGTGDTGNANDGPGGINFGSDGAQQRQIARDLFGRRSRESLRDFRDDRNRRTAEPSTAN